nr:unnamed protein product [Callosobruchus chinensis]
MPGKYSSVCGAKSEVLYMSSISICFTGKYTCGRCCPTAETCGPYEEIAKHILFPCSNAHCKTKIKWGEVTAHENACVFRKISCPFLACSNRISINEVLSHFTVDHKVLVPEHRCCISIEYSQGPPQVKIHCFSYKKIGFLVFVKTTTDVPKHTVSFGVAALPTTVPDKSFHDISTSGSCVLKKIGKRISQYDEDKHCVYCIVGKCNKFEHHRDDFWDVEFTGIDSNYYQDDIKCIVKVEKSFPLRESLECPICKNYMESTIYICPNGHSLCKECRFKVNTCPLCNSAMGTTRNYTLEDLAETLEVPCHNDYNGCQFIGEYTCGRCRPSADSNGPYEEIAKYIEFPCSNKDCKVKLKWDDVKDHEAVCPFGYRKCPVVTCPAFFRFNNMLRHFNAAHEAFVHQDQCNLFLKLNQASCEVAIHCLSCWDTEFLVFVKTIITDRSWNKFSFGVASLPNSALDLKKSDTMYYTVHLHLTLHSGGCVSKKFEQRIHHYDFDKHCENCFRGKCNKTDHQDEKFLNMESEIIDANDYKGDVQCTIKVTRSSQVYFFSITFSQAFFLKFITAIKHFNSAIQNNTKQRYYFSVPKVLLLMSRVNVGSKQKSEISCNAFG